MRRTTRLGHDRYCTEITDQTGRLRATLHGADWSAAVPTCPGWTLLDLVRHVGGNLHAVGAAVRNTVGPLRDGRADDAAGPGTDAPAVLDAWLARQAEECADALREAGPDLDVAVWTIPGTALSWARRATHDLVVHRADAAAAVDADYTVAPEVAADTVTELLELFGAPGAVAFPGDGGRTIGLHAADPAGRGRAEWLVEVGEQGLSWRFGRGRADVTVRGALTDVLRLCHRRLPVDSDRVEVRGDVALLDRWLEQVALR